MSANGRTLASQTVSMAEASQPNQLDKVAFFKMMKPIIGGKVLRHTGVK